MSGSDLASRREFFRLVFATSLAATVQPRAARGQVPTAPTGVRVRGGKELLKPNDWQYLGSISLDSSYDTRMTMGLQLRRVGSELRAFCPDRRAHLIEFRLPDVGGSATALRDWGALPLSPLRLRSLTWDDVDQRLYSFGQDEYNNDPQSTVFCSTLDGPNATLVHHGPWRLANRSPRMCNSGGLLIPTEWAAQHVGGRRLAIGFGGYNSRVSEGPSSLGPALAAIAPPSLHTAAEAELPNTPLLGFPFGAVPPASRPFSRLVNNIDVADDDGSLQTQTQPVGSERFSGDEVCRWQPHGTTTSTPRFVNGSRPTGQPRTIASAHPAPGTAYWTWTEQQFHQMVWVDTPTSHGLVGAIGLAWGRCQYEASQIWRDGAEDFWMVLDPVDLAEVADGRKAQHEVQVARWTQMALPGFGYPRGGGYSTEGICGLAFDPASGRLFAKFRDNAPWPSYRSLIYVWQVH